jgi:hypothetical protein
MFLFRYFLEEVTIVTNKDNRDCNITIFLIPFIKLGFENNRRNV